MYNKCLDNCITPRQACHMSQIALSERQVAFRCARSISGRAPVRQVFGIGSAADLRRAELRRKLRANGIGSRRAYELVEELFTP